MAKDTKKKSKSTGKDILKKARPAKSSGATKYAQPLASEIVVDQDQSFELVRTVISAAISNITWIRDVFPNDCYGSRVYDFSDPDPSYEAFMNGQKAFVLEKNPNLAYWRVLVRGSDPGVDKFLDWLEHGVAHALERKFLSTLQLSFYEGEVSPSTLIEAYIVSITYKDGIASMQLETESRTSKKNVAASLLLSDAKLGIRNLINSVIISAQDLPSEMPANRVADMQLTYTDDCPMEYNPPGFRTCEDPNLIVDGKGTTRCDSMSTGHHGIRIKLFSNNDHDAEASRNIAAQVTSGVAEQLENRVSPSKGVSREQNGPIKPHRPYSQRKPSLSSETDGGETQEAGLNALRSIGVTRDPAGETQDTQPLYGVFSQPPAPNGAACVSQDSPSDVQPYSQAVKTRIEKARRRAEYALVGRSDEEIDNIQDAGQRISCECETFAGGIMLECGICKDLQHIECYGYLDVPRTSEFVCYTCLLEDEDTLITEMRELCIKRRAIYFMREEGVSSLKDLSAHLNRDEVTTRNILGQLKSQGFVTESINKRTGRKSKGRSGEAVFSLINDEEKLRRNYFCPTLNIAHHFAVAEIRSPSNTLISHGLGEHDQLDHSKPTTKSVSELSTSDHSNGLQLSFRAGRASLGEGSSTEGTPSPHSSIRYTTVPQTQTPFREADSRQASLHTKRAADTEREGFEKRVKVSSARSPWLFSRK